MSFNKFNIRFAIRKPVRDNQAFFQLCTDHYKIPLKLRFSLLIGKFGVHLNIPWIAERYGEVMYECGNGYVYSGWLGRHHSI